MAVSVYYLSAAVGSVPLSRLTERAGSTRVMRAVAVVILGLLLTLATLTSSWVVLALLLAPCGVISAAALPATRAYVSLAVHGDHQGLAFSAN